MMLSIFSTLDTYAQKLVDAFTLGQLSSAQSIYHHWLSSASTYNPNVVAYMFAAFIVIIKFLVPLIFVTLVLRTVTKNLYIISGVLILTLIAYSFLYFDPVTLFNDVTKSTTNFIHFIESASTMTTKPLVFTFLNNMLAVFSIKLLVSFLGMWLFFAIVLGFITLVIYIITAGKNPWDITNKNFKVLTFQLALVFMIFYPIFGALRAFITVFALLIGGTEIYAGIMTLRGYQKTCYNDGNTIKCVWKK